MTLQTVSVQTPAVRVAAVVPIFKHSGLLPEAVECLLAQDADFGIAIVLVNDGCPFIDTDEVCRQYAAAYPGEIFYIHKKNGGLSSARNAGIDFARSAFPELEAIYLMDADNRIKPRLLQKSLDLLRASPDTVAWIYPDIDKFGLREPNDMSGAYNPYEHLIWNFCEAGSMIRASVFDQGARYDEQMKLGYEDWEFWLQCLDLGLVGRHLPDSGFRYRQRSESMLKESERNHEEIMSYILKKHKDLFSRANLLALEEAWAPRHAVFFHDEGTFAYLTGPAAEPATAGEDDFLRRLAVDAEQPQFGRLPSYFVSVSRACYNELIATGLWPGLIFRAECALDSRDVVAFEIDSAPGDAAIFRIETGDGPLASSDVLVLKSRTVEDHVLRAGPDDVLLDDPGRVETALRLKIVVRMPDMATRNALYRANGTALAALLERLKTAVAGMTFGIMPRTPVYDIRRQFAFAPHAHDKLFRLPHVLPLGAPNGARNIGFLVPVAQFGGVEKVAHSYAQVMRARGWRVHLFVVQSETCTLPDNFTDAYDSISFFHHPALQPEQAYRRRDSYLGVALPHVGDGDALKQAAGMLLPMDAVINFNVVAFHSIVASLKRFGIRMFSSQHLVDRTAFNQPLGTPHEFLAYEHGYEGVLTISDQMTAWFRAMGVPRDKLIQVPNAASYPISETEKAALRGARQSRDASQPLRVLFIGRFDKQKGLDRLAALVRRAQSLPVEWRIVGKAILSDDDGPWPEILTPLLSPPVFNTEGLSAHYGWADIMVMPSRFEGVPLSILEAAQTGCVTLCTDVGAVRELITDQVNGVIIDEGGEAAIIGRFVAEIERLCADRERLKRLALRAMDEIGGRSWDASLDPFLKTLVPATASDTPRP